MTIKAIIWDMGGVILRMADEKPRHELAAQFNLPLRQIYWEIFESPWAMQSATGEISIPQHWQLVGQHLSLSGDQILPFFEKFWSADEIDYSLIDSIICLKDHFKIGLLSNAGDNLRDLIQTTWGIASTFDDMIISAEVGLVKPDERIYHLAVNRLGVEPEEAVFIDDLFENVHAARRVGLKAIQYTSNQQVFHALVKILAIENPEVRSPHSGSKVTHSPALIEEQINLEYARTQEGLLLSYPGSTEQALYVVYQYQNGFHRYLNQALDPTIRKALHELDPSTAFLQPDVIINILGTQLLFRSGGIYLNYVFAYSPLPAEFPQVTQKAARFEIRINGEPVSWAWSIRENETCAEIAVETLPTYRRNGFARQVAAAWAHEVILQGKLAFFSHLASNQASRSLAQSLGVIRFARSISFEQRS